MDIGHFENFLSIGIKDLIGADDLERGIFRALFVRQRDSSRGKCVLLRGRGDFKRSHGAMDLLRFVHLNVII